MQERTTKADQAYSLLRRAIIVGDISAGEPLDEVELTRRFDIGRTPAREALKRLAMEQFILWPARRTPYVREMSHQDVRRLFESRLLMEKPAAGLAAARITDAQMETVQQLGNELRAAADAGDVYRSVEADHALHIAITRGSDNRFLSEAVDRLNCGSLRLWYLAHEQLGLQHVADTHQTLIDAIRSRDPAIAEAAVHEHIMISVRHQFEVNIGGPHNEVVEGLVAPG